MSDHQPRRLVLLFDGTWDRREDTTNVWRFYLMLRKSPDQVVYYDEGVGTQPGAALVGGAFASGLSRKVLNGYLWLMENYQDTAESERGIADSLYILGFSRGAFSARSLLGTLSISGLLRKDATRRIIDVFALSTVPALMSDAEAARSFRTEFSREVTVTFVGVWDTVGALGVPYLSLPFLEQFNHHKVRELPPIVQHARHALALDEHRKIFRPTKWPGRTREDQTLEQRWFSGAHANIGGGYRRDALFVRPLQWMRAAAEEYGLQFCAGTNSLDPLFYCSCPRDSLDETFWGAYYLSQWFHRYDRRLDLHGEGNETIDYTALQRWLWDASYKCPTLEDALGGRSHSWAPSAFTPSDDILALLPDCSLECTADGGFRLKRSGP